jgi:hypothetical protein
LFSFHSKNLERLTGDLDIKKTEIQELKSKNDKISKEKEKFVFIEKNKIIQKIKDTKILDMKRRETERNYIKLILGLDIIYKYQFSY